ncbi:MAG TPA: hypothetical protein VGL88_10250 [Pseudonocardiaceae bacterium]
MALSPSLIAVAAGQRWTVLIRAFAGGVDEAGRFAAALITDRAHGAGSGGTGARGLSGVSLSVASRVVGWSCEELPDAATGAEVAAQGTCPENPPTFPMGLL